MFPILDSLNDLDEVLIWDNSKREDLAVYGRYALIHEARNNVIFVQDDDVILPSSSVAEIVREWLFMSNTGGGAWPGVVCNMPQEFRHDGYTDSALVGFGACFHRDAPERAFEGWTYQRMLASGGTCRTCEEVDRDTRFFQRTCDVVFTTLTPRVLVDVPFTHREFASAPNRMWKQPGHYGERTRMLGLARQARDGN